MAHLYIDPVNGAQGLRPCPLRLSPAARRRADLQNVEALLWPFITFPLRSLAGLSGALLSLRRHIGPGAKMVDARTGETHDFTRKGGVFHDEIMEPSNAPTWTLDRSESWNHVEQIERRKDAQLCHEFNIALPRELDREQQLALARDFVRRELVDKGMVVQLEPA